MPNTQSIVAAVPGITPKGAFCCEQVTLTVIETGCRRVVSVHEFSDRKQALAIFSALGHGYDAHIRTPKYSELILSIENGN